MNFSDQTLLKKLAVVVVIKLIFLLAIWLAFVRGHGVSPDQNSVAAQLLQHPVATGEGTTK